ncbi:MAG TPA: hypothetical protein VGR14_23445 [Verrucomicrobiae bacterium]|nr:hypothetical protein [Verrucomicrobiae bacterium]
MIERRPPDWPLIVIPAFRQPRAFSKIKSSIRGEGGRIPCISEGTHILEALEHGDAKAADESPPQAYGDLRKLAVFRVALSLNNLAAVLSSQVKLPVAESFMLSCQSFCAFVPGISPWLAVGEFAQKQKLKPGAERRNRKAKNEESNQSHKYHKTPRPIRIGFGGSHVDGPGRFGCLGGGPAAVFAALWIQL